MSVLCAVSHLTKKDMLTKSEIKHIRGLQDKKHRDESGLFVAEGAKWIEELLQWQPGWIEKIIADEEWISQMEGNLPGDQLCAVKSYEMEKISSLSSPASVIALVKRPIYDLPAFDPDRWNLVLDGIQDPGNLGSIIRIADWFGLTDIWCSKDTADAFGPKVVQATMGSLCRVRVHYCKLSDLLSSTPIPVYLTSMEGHNVFDTKAHCGILVIGSEGKGVRPEVAEKGSHTLSIPRIGHAESLNAAVAAGIIIARLTSPKEKSKGH